MHANEACLEELGESCESLKNSISLIGNIKNGDLTGGGTKWKTKGIIAG